MAKKKKSALPAVSRGFATSSIPKTKKALEVEAEQAAEAAAQAEAEAAAAAVVSSANGAGGAGGGPGVEGGGGGAEGHGGANGDVEEDWEKEGSYLQGLVERLQDKVEKEVARGLKTMDFEKRQAKGFARFEVPEAIKDRALELVIKAQDAETALPPVAGADSEKLLLRLAITQGILVKIGFSAERVEECLRAIPNWELDEALDWLYLHCSEDEIMQEGEFVPKAEVPQSSLPASFASSPPPSRPASRPSSPPLTAKSSLPPTPTQPLSSNSSQPRTRTNTSASITAPSSMFAAGADSDSSDGELEEPNTEFAKLRLRLEQVLGVPNGKDGGKKKGGAGGKKGLNKLKLSLASAANEPEEAGKIRKRMDVVKGMYMYAEKDSDAEYKALKLKADAKALEDRLAGRIPAATPPSSTLSPARSPQEEKPALDILDALGGLGVEDDSAEPDGLGGLFEPAEPNADVDTGHTITVRPMPLPRSYASSSPTPKSTLQTLVVKLDKFALIDYTTTSNSHRAARVRLKIRWGSTGHEQGWAMEDIGCHTVAEAENYVATLAVHQLNAVEGKGEKGLWRVLPPVFRDLWDELDEVRKENVDKARREKWGVLRAILDTRIAEDDPESKPTSKSNSKLIPGFDCLPPPPPMPAPELSKDASARLQAEFARRQSTPAYQKMLKQRSTLPISAYRETIVEALETSQILVLSGETGCGKSTQLPSFLLEDQLSKGKPCKIYVTEPRRISAISLAQRVSQELGDSAGQVGTMNSLVGYSIRLESCVSKNTRLAFVTNGIALRMLESGTGVAGGKGTAFDEITHIIVDEVHERSIESDFLLIVLKTLLEQRKDLKVVLMSATVDAEKISDFFGGCPTLSVPGRTFPVTTCFLEDAIQTSKWFINQDSPYARRKNKFDSRPAKLDWNEDVVVEQQQDDDDENADKPSAPVKLEKKYSEKTVKTVNLLDERLIAYDLIVRLLERLCFEDPTYQQFSASVLIFMPGMNEIRRLNDMLQEHPAFGSQDFVIYPLHSSVSSEGQSAVFNTPPPGVRKIVISTNIAETGVTIPDVVCVIDSGKHREMRFDEKRQISKLVECWIAKSNAAQRRGRAGRVQEGLAFHLFSKLRHETQMQDHPLPEMLRLSLQDLSLRIKILKIKIGSTIEEVLSKALDPPLPLNIQRAVSSLVEVKALTANEDITPMGRLLSKLPMDVHLGKFLLVAALFKCLDPALTIAATLNSKSPFVAPFGLEQEADRAKASFKTGNSDFLTLANAFSSWRRASANPNFVRVFCRKNFLSHQNLQQIEELRQQLFSYLVDSGFVTVSDEQRNMMSRMRFSRSRAPRFLPIPAALDVNSADEHTLSAALAAGLFPKILSIDPQSWQLRTYSNNQPASIHPSSVNFRMKPADWGTNHLAFFTIMHSKKLYAWETGPVDDRALVLLCGEADFKLAALSLQLDRKLKLFVPPKMLIALKHLRSNLDAILSIKMRGKEISPEQEEWWDLCLEIVGREKATGDEAIASAAGVVG